MDAWIDTYHAVRGLTRQGTFVFLTDNAVGAQEEDNLRHLVTNLGLDVPRQRIVPFLTSKHPLDYCLSYAERAHQHGFPGAGRARRGQGGRPASQRRARLAAAATAARAGRQRCRSAAGPIRMRRPSGRSIFSAEQNFCAEFYLTQIVSHHDMAPVARFIAAAERRGLTLPGLFGVFFYRSANRKTMDALKSFLPVPIEPLTREFEQGRPPKTCAPAASARCSTPGPGTSTSAICR